MPGVDEEALGARGQHPDTEAPALRVSGIVGGWTRPQRLDARVGEGDVGHGRFFCGQLQPGNRSREGPFPHGGFDRRTRRRIKQLAPQVRSLVFGQGAIQRGDSGARRIPAGSPSCAGTIQGAWIHGEFRRVNSLTDHGCRATEGV